MEKNKQAEKKEKKQISEKKQSRTAKTKGTTVKEKAVEQVSKQSSLEKRQTKSRSSVIPKKRKTLKQKEEKIIKEEKSYDSAGLLTSKKVPKKKLLEQTADNEKQKIADLAITEKMPDTLIEEKTVQKTSVSSATQFEGQSERILQKDQRTEAQQIEQLITSSKESSENVLVEETIAPTKEKPEEVSEQSLNSLKEDKVSSVLKEKQQISPIKEEIASEQLFAQSSHPQIQAPSSTTELKELIVEYPVTVKDLSVRLQEKPSVIIKLLIDMGIMVPINQALSEKAVAEVCARYGYRPVAKPEEEEQLIMEHMRADDPKDLKPRWPIVTFMGHVDHGKTSLLDAIRQTKVADSEFGGITQHIGAYRVKLPKGEITFLDTPGHEAFTAMRARGAKVTDIVVIVVAADDGVMPQTQEAIDHAKAAAVTIVVAINKIDKPEADINRVKKQLASLGLVAEDWGGKTVMVPVSAKTHQGIDELLEMILLEAELLELKANPNRAARGVVLEAKLVKNKGPVATFLVQNGTLYINDYIVAGSVFGKIRAMFNDHGKQVSKAGPSEPVEVLGLSGVPEAGEQFFVVKDEKLAKEIVQKRIEKQRLRQMQPVKRMSLDDLYSQVKSGKIKELNIILKADAQGSIEAIKEALKKIPDEEVKLVIIHEGIGNVNASDVILAVASNALVLGFNVVVDEQAKPLVDKEGVDVRIYNVIYELVNQIRQALEGMLAPKLKKVFLGRAEVRKVFKLSSGNVAGCYVVKGKIMRSAQITVVRNGTVIFEGEIANLKRFKDDVREVEEGFECGITLKNFQEILEGDTIEAFTIQKIARTL
ncbi:MAG: translation initiation factor IF-2 [Candidatus Omnitrophica bacterium]|nr:translation initiation factor IF-2 [Candidatus Omnitrophota bacterium]